MKSMTHELSNGKIVTGKFYCNVGLRAKFEIWARQFGLSDAEGLACWIHGNDDEKRMYFKTMEGANELAERGFAKLGDVEIPDLSGF